MCSSILLGRKTVRSDFIKANITSRPMVPTAKSPDSEPWLSLPGMCWGSSWLQPGWAHLQHVPLSYWPQRWPNQWLAEHLYSSLNDRSTRENWKFRIIERWQSFSVPPSDKMKKGTSEHQTDLTVFTECSSLEPLEALGFRSTWKMYLNIER